MFFSGHSGSSKFRWLKLMCCPQPRSEGKTLSHVLICCNLSKMFDSTIRGRHQHLTPQRTVLPQHFCKWGLSIEAATLHRLRHMSLCVGGGSFHISRWMEKLNISFAILNRINKPHHVSTKLSHWRGNRSVFSLKYTFDLWEPARVCSCFLWKRVFSFSEEVLSQEREPIEPNLSILDRMPSVYQAQHPFSYNSTHKHNFWKKHTFPAGIKHKQYRHNIM